MRKRVGYCLTGVLVCDHCGGGMYGTKLRGQVVYRCVANVKNGAGACGHRQIHEEDILPFVLRTLGEEIEDIKKMISEPPESLVEPHKEAETLRRQKEQAREELADRVATAEENLMFTKDARTRRSLDQKVTALRDELDSWNTELSTDARSSRYTDADYVLLTEWSDVRATAVTVPINKEIPHAIAVFYRDHFVDDEQTVMLDPRAANEALLDLGAEVRLRWTSEPGGTRKNKKTGEVTITMRHTLARGRFRLGQQKGILPRHVLATSVARSICYHSGCCRSPWPSSRTPTAS